MNLDVLVEAESCLHKQEEEVIEVKISQHQGETHIRKIQCQVNMDSYKVILSVMHAIVMEIFPINTQINNQNQLVF